jgi:uncharacterized protein involved in response to NO
MSATALFNLGFRPFFLGAALFAVASMMLWLAIYAGHYSPEFNGISASQWHAHALIYGYAMAVIAGFLLTAIRNWTGERTPHGTALIALFTLWLVARVLLGFGTRFLPAAATVDLLFGLLLVIACMAPIVRTRQWKQMAVLSKLMLLVAGNALFYAGAFGKLENGLHWGLYGGFYLIIALILTMARRLLPFFLERGMTPAPHLRNSRALDLSSLVLALVFWVTEVFVVRPNIVTLCSAGLCVVNALRLALWYTPGLWRYPLLWSLYLSVALIAAGFGLRALSPALSLSPFIALHLLAIGGIGLITLSMMARVSLGHTGRNVHAPPSAILPPLYLMLIAVMVRVLVPWLAPAWVVQSVYVAQLAWIMAFLLFSATWIPMLIRPRIDAAEE